MRGRGHRGGAWPRVWGGAPAEVRALEEWEVDGAGWGFLLTCGLRILGCFLPLALARPARPIPIPPPEHISLKRLSNELMHILAASIKLNQAIRRLPFFGLAFVGELPWEEELTSEAWGGPWGVWGSRPWEARVLVRC